MSSGAASDSALADSTPVTNTAAPVLPPITAPITSNVPLLLSYVTIPSLWVATQHISIHYTVQVCVYCAAILYAGCHASLVLLNENSAHYEVDKMNDGSEIVVVESENVAEVMQASDAMQFPLVGSCGLFGLYIAFKFFEAETVNLVIGVYFCLVGWVAVGGTIEPIVRLCVPKKFNKVFGWEWKINHPLPKSIGGESPWDLSVEGTTSDILSTFIAAVVSYRYFHTRHWTQNNILGICFCLQGIHRFSLGTFKIAAILLVGLFFYDIFWVFGTDVMVTVAKSIDGPIKLLFPRSLIKNEDGKIDMSLLGLGDIVIPGFFIALLLRFDAVRDEKRRYGTVPGLSTTNSVDANDDGTKDKPLVLLPPLDPNVQFPKPYFHACMVGYMVGIITTLFVMIHFEAAQPALLYLVPACLGSALGTAAIRGEMAELFAYSEEEAQEEGDEKNKDSDKPEEAKKED